MSSSYKSTSDLFGVNQKGVGKKPRHERRFGNACTLMLLGVTITGVICTTCIGAIYINHLQQHVSNLEQRVEVLQQKSCKNVQDKADAGEHEELLVVLPRAKRQAEDIEPPQHRTSHHGIASHQIAFLYGDPSNIVTDNSTDFNQRFKVNQEFEERKKCGTLFERADEQLWCTPKSLWDIGRYMTSRANDNYDYFKKAAWMNSTKASQHFDLAREGRVLVHREGVYIVHASVHFRNVGKRDNPHYGVYKEDRLGNNRKLLSKCVVTSTPSIGLEGNIHPCEAWQLVHLKAGDAVFLNIGGYVWFDVQKDSLHLALIRLNSMEP